MAHCKTFYIVSGERHLVRFGKHGWFGGEYWTMAKKGFGTFIQTQSLRHANAIYSKLKIEYRQIDIRQSGNQPRVLKYGKMI